MSRAVAFFLFSLVLTAPMSYAADATAPHIIISEIAAHEKTGNEWIEIYNRNESPIDLMGWKFFETSGTTQENHKLKFLSDSAILNAHSFAIIAQDTNSFITAHPNQKILIIDSAWGTLSESGELIGLRDANETIVEQFTYLPHTFSSLKRINLLYDMYDASNWQEMIAPNPMVEAIVVLPTIELITSSTMVAAPQNISEMSTSTLLIDLPIALPPTQSDEQKEPIVFNTKKTTRSKKFESPEIIQNTPASLPPQMKIRFSELLPNPADRDTQEFIELYNAEEFAVDLKEYRIMVGSTRFTLGITDETRYIGPHNYLLLYKTKTKLNLPNNRAYTIELLDAFDRTLDSVRLAPEILSNVSLMIDEEYAAWTTHLTPGEKNSMEPVNEPPEALLDVPRESSATEVMQLSAEKSYDPDLQPLIFSWNFGDGSPAIFGTSSLVAHVYEKPGWYTIKLSAHDGFATTTDSARIRIYAAAKKSDEEKRNTVLPVESSHTSSTITMARHTKAKKTKKSSKTMLFSFVPLAHIATLQKDAHVVTEGIITVPPKILGNKVAYIGNPGVEIYFHKAHFPDLIEGDIVRISGTLSFNQSMPRIKMMHANDLKKIGTAPKILPYSFADIDVHELHAGSLVTLEGEVIDVQRKKIIVATDTDEEVFVPMPEGSARPQLGDTISSTGIIKKTNSGFAIAPHKEPYFTVTGHTNYETTFPAVHRNFRDVVHTALPAVAGGIVSIIMAFIWKRRTRIIASLSNVLHTI